MAAYNRSEAVDIYYGAPATAPKRQQPQENPEHRPQPQGVDIKTRKEAISSALHALKLFAVSVTLLVLFGSVLFSRISLAVLEREATQIQSSISDAQSENTRLQMAFNSSVSMEKVEEYAVSVLGMQKIERYQIRYFDNRDGDKVVVADGEITE